MTSGAMLFLENVFPLLKSVIRNNKMDLFGSPLNIFSAWFRDNYPAVSDDSTSISPGIPWFCFLDGFSWPFYVIAIFESLLCIFIFRPFCIKPTLVETLMLIDFVYCFEKYEINANFWQCLEQVSTEITDSFDNMNNFRLIESVLELVEGFLARFDEELEQIRIKNSIGAGKKKRNLHSSRWHNKTREFGGTFHWGVIPCQPCQFLS